MSGRAKEPEALWHRTEATSFGEQIPGLMSTTLKLQASENR
ncbi:MAG: hypothetical protein ACI9QN_001362 [Arcticibacterium sp.]|jgi:hypothetical protein